MKRSLIEDQDHPVRILPVDLPAEVVEAVAVIQNQKEVRFYRFKILFLFI